MRSADGADVTAPEIDGDPLQLLPPGSVSWFHLDVATAAQSDLGQYVLADLEARMPMPEGAGFSLRRDVSQLSVALYSMQGVDFAGVAIGRFDPGKINAAALEYKGGSLAPPLV